MILKSRYTVFRNLRRFPQVLSQIPPQKNYYDSDITVACLFLSIIKSYQVCFPLCLDLLLFFNIKSVRYIHIVSVVHSLQAGYFSLNESIANYFSFSC